MYKHEILSSFTIWDVPEAFKVPLWSRMFKGDLTVEASRRIFRSRSPPAFDETRRKLRLSHPDIRSNFNQFFASVQTNVNKSQNNNRNNNNNDNGNNNNNSDNGNNSNKQTMMKTTIHCFSQNRTLSFFWWFIIGRCKLCLSGSWCPSRLPPGETTTNHS